MVCAEAVSSVLVDGGHASNSASGCVDTASNRFDLASDCIVLAPLLLPVIEIFSWSNADFAGRIYWPFLLLGFFQRQPSSGSLAENWTTSKDEFP
jgi:hypothetical protein